MREKGNVLTQSAIHFREKRYLIVKNFLPQPLLDYLKVYYEILRANDYLQKDSQCPLSLSIGGDPAFDAVLNLMNAELNRRVGFELAPTHSYTRIYSKGDVLERHCDRPECEIAVTISIAIPNGAGPSIIHLKPPKVPEVKIEMLEGDGCVYAGTEVEHWREPFLEEGYIQLFLFFIDKNGPYFPDLLYDRRKCLGAPCATLTEQDVKKIPGQKIAVTVLLKDGHERRVILDVADPSLTLLLEAVAKKQDKESQATVFNLEMEGGQGSLFFAATDLIAVSTNPAISIDLQIDA
jgi:hypothetical protein